MADYAGVSLTDAQHDAVTATGQDILVSAAAGSGKTRVLSARAVYLMADAPEPCDAADLLVVTFTRKAATEMRGRIADVLDQRATTAEGELHTRLQRQRMLLGRAQIGTVHSFCQALLRRHFEAARLDPNFVVLEDDAAFLMRRRVMGEVLNRWFDESRGDFYKLVESYGGSSDGGIASTLLRLHGLLASMPDPSRWRERALAQIEGDDFIHTVAGMIAATLDPQRGALFEHAEQFARLDAAGELPKNFAAYVTDFAETIAQLHDMADAGQLDEARSTFEAWQKRWRSIPAIKADHPHKQRRDAFAALRDRIVKDDTFNELLRFSNADWSDSLKRIRPFAPLLMELLADFQACFEREKRLIRAVDFNDLEALSLRLLRENLDVAEREQSRIRHVLVDEAQDLNPLQDELLRAIAPPGRSFFVGDTKQSIYRFRLADVTLFAGRESAFERGEGGRLIRLSRNYRSSGRLLGSINDIFGTLMRGGPSEIDYAAGHRLEPGRSLPVTEAPAIEVNVLPAVAATDEDEQPTESDEREALFIARRLRAMIGKEQITANNEVTTLRPGHCAVLLRTAKHQAEIVSRVLRRFGIPVQADVTTGFFDALEIRDVLSVLETIANGRQDIPLAAAVRSPLLAIEDATALLANIRLAAPDGTPMLFHEALAFAADRDDALGEQLRREVREPLRRFRALFGRLPVGDALWALLTQETQYLTWCRSLDDGRQREANVLELLDRARRHDATDGGGLAAWLRSLSILRAESELGQPDDLRPAGDAVRVMSVHASKGLEFPVVFLPQMGRAFNESDLNANVLFDRDAGIGLRAVDLDRKAHWPSASSVVVRDALRKRGRAEEMRVLYVALTRAEQHVIAIGSERAAKTSPTPVEPMSARTPLAWLRHTANITGAIGFNTHEPDDQHLWADERPDKAATGRLAKVARFADLGGNPEQGQSTVQRALQAPTALDLPQATSVTGLSRLEKRELVGLLPEQEVAAQPLPLRSSLFVENTATAGEVGSATHTLLDHLDYRRAGSVEDVAEQADALVDRGYLQPMARAALDLPSVVWMATGPVGDAVRGSDDVRRELPFMRLLPDAHLLGRGHRVDADRPLLRGRLDLAIARNRQWTLVDFKTDKRVADDLDTYDTQLGLYADMLTELTGMPVIQRLLVFLTPRQVVSL
ncbi:MAG: UvrD-helicase domain-containing protein [Planctomycetota bacterium]